jgi:peroxiredoxin
LARTDDHLAGQPRATAPQSGAHSARPALIGRALLLLALMTPSALPAQRVKVGARAPDFSLERLDGGNAKIRLSQLKGRPLVISFWATWCPPCRKEMPELAAAYTAHRSFGLEILAVNEEALEVDDKGHGVYRSNKEQRKQLQSFLKEFVMPFSVLLDDTEGGVWSRYGNPMLPAMFFVDTGGIIRTMYLKGGVTADSVAKGLKSILPSS